MEQKPLKAEMESLKEVNLKEFPVVEDFVVVLSDHVTEIRLEYQAPSVEISVSFPWWNHSVDEMRTWGPEEFPCGSLNEPFWDRDQGWNLLIWLVEDRIFIAEGDGEADVYQRWFAVSAELYRSEWTRAIAQLKGDS